MGGHRLVQRGPEMTGVWVAVVKGTVGMCRVAHFRRALRQVCRQHPRSSCREEESSWHPPSGRCQSRAARTWGNTQVRKAPLSHHAESKKKRSKWQTGGREVGPTHLWPVEESRSLTQNRVGYLGAGVAWGLETCIPFVCNFFHHYIFFSQTGSSPLCTAPLGRVPGAPGGQSPPEHAQCHVEWALNQTDPGLSPSSSTS